MQKYLEDADVILDDTGHAKLYYFEGALICVCIRKEDPKYSYVLFMHSREEMEQDIEDMLEDQYMQIDKGVDWINQYVVK